MAEQSDPQLASSARIPWFVWGLAGTAFIAALGACDVFNFDVGLHILKGQFVLEKGSLPRPEDFTCVKRPGFSYQDRWLFQVGTWLTWKAGGWTGLTLMKIAGLLLTFACLWVSARPAGPMACMAATVLAALLMYERWDIRSELSAHLACAAVLALVGRSPRPDRAAWAAPPVVAIAMNMHALSILAPVVVTVAAAAAVVHTRREHLRAWTAIAGLSWAAVLLNPAGWRVVAVPFEYLHRYRTGPAWYQGWITELQGVTDAVAFPSVSLRAPWIVVPVAVLALLANRRRIRALDAALLALGTLAAFSYRRNVAAAGPLLFPVIARNLHEAVTAWAASRPAPSLRFPRVAAATLLGATAALLAALSLSDLWAVSERSSRRAGLGASRLTLPVDACDFIAREGLEGNAFTNWDAGCYYALRHWPRSLPSTTSEADWNLENLEEYDRVTRLLDPFDAYADRYGIEIAVLLHQSADTRPLIADLLENPRWGLAWRDVCAVVFLRRDGRNAEKVRRLAPEGRPLPVPAIGEGVPGGIWPFGEGERRSEAVRVYRVGSLLALADDPGQEECWERAIALWPGYPEAHNNAGTWLARRGDPRAEQEFREAVRIAPQYVPARRNLARWMLGRRDEAGAVHELEEGLREVESAELCVDLGELMRARGDAGSLERARKLAQRALAVRPGHGRAQALLEGVGGGR